MQRFIALTVALAVSGPITIAGLPQPPGPVLVHLTQLPSVGQANVTAEFRLSETGGSVRLVPARPGDAAARDAIWNYGMILQKQITAHEFSALSELTPFATESLVRMVYESGASVAVQKIENGIALSFAASDQTSRTAIHDYIRHARGQPELTAAERGLNHPGNNLGWDAPRSDDSGK